MTVLLASLVIVHCGEWLSSLIETQNTVETFLMENQDAAQSSEEQRKFRKAKQNAQTSIKEMYNPPQKVVSKEPQLPEPKKRNNQNSGNKSSRNSQNQECVLEDHGSFLYIVPKRQKTSGSNKFSTTAKANLTCRQEVQASGESRVQANLVSDAKNYNGNNKSIKSGEPNSNNFQQFDINQIGSLKRGDCVLLESGQVCIVIEPLQQREQLIEVQIFLTGEDVQMAQLGDIPELYLSDQVKKISAAEICRKVVLHFNQVQKSTEFVCRQLCELDTSDNQYVFRRVDINALE